MKLIKLWTNGIMYKFVFCVYAHIVCIVYIVHWPCAQRIMIMISWVTLLAMNQFHSSSTVPHSASCACWMGAISNIHAGIWTLHFSRYAIWWNYSVQSIANALTRRQRIDTSQQFWTQIGRQRRSVAGTKRISVFITNFLQGWTRRCRSLCSAHVIPASVSSKHLRHCNLITYFVFRHVSTNDSTRETYETGIRSAKSSPVLSSYLTNSSWERSQVSIKQKIFVLFVLLRLICP